MPIKQFTLIISICTLIMFVDQVKAATIYVATSGDDSEKGLLPSQPVKTIGKAVKLANSGDVIKIAQGTYPESITINKPNLSFVPQDNQNVVISGAERISGWKNYTGHIYVAQVGNPVSQLFVNNVAMIIARYPAKGYLTIDQNSDASNAQTSLTSQALSHIYGQDLKRATVRVRTETYDLSTASITNVSGNTLYWDTKTRYSVKAQYGFYLENKLWMLTGPGQWCYDNAAHLLYAWLPDGGDPSLSMYKMEASERDKTLQVQEADGINISGIAFDKATSYGIYINKSKNVHLDNIILSNIGTDGVFIDTGDNAVIENSLITDVNLAGVYTKNSANTQILNNHFKRIGVMTSPRNTLAAIFQDYTSTGVQIIGNIIEESGYHGIFFNRESLVKNNKIDNACMIFSDCAGIYTFGWHNVPDNPNAFNPPFNSTVTANQISNTHGGSEGIPPASMVKRPNAGIYLDSLSNGIIISDNILTDNDVGIFFHDAHEIKFTSNQIKGGTEQMLFEESGAFHTEKGFMKNILIEGNHLTAAPVTQSDGRDFLQFASRASVPAVMLSVYDDIPEFAIFKKNAFSITPQEYAVQLRYKDNCGKMQKIEYSFTQFQSFLSSEPHCK